MTSNMQISNPRWQFTRPTDMYKLKFNFVAATNNVLLHIEERVMDKNAICKTTTGKTQSCLTLFSFEVYKNRKNTSKVVLIRCDKYSDTVCQGARWLVCPTKLTLAYCEASPSRHVCKLTHFVYKHGTSTLNLFCNLLKKAKKKKKKKKGARRITCTIYCCYYIKIL